MSGLSDQPSPSWSTFYSEFEKGKYREVLIEGRQITAIYGDSEQANADKSRKKVTLYGPDRLDGTMQLEMKSIAQKTHTEIKFVMPSALTELLIGIIPWLIPIALLYFFVFRQMRGPGGPGGVLSFGKSRATLITKDKCKKTFKDVAGVLTKPSKRSRKSLDS